MGRSSNGPVDSQRKKLIEAGYRIAKGTGDAGLAEDSEIFNLPSEYLERHAPQNFVVDFDNWPIYELFQLCGTQWRVAPSGGRIGLDYTAVLAVASSEGINEPGLMRQIRFMELGAITAYSDNDLEVLLYGQ